MKYNLIMARFSEIAIKSNPVRKRLIKILLRNIKKALLKNKIDANVYAKWERIFVETKNIKKTTNILRHIFGIISISPSIKVKLSDLEKIIKNYAYLAESKTFAVRVKRIGNHVFTSKDMEKKLGYIILNEANSRVNLEKPDVTFYIEIRDDDAYLYFDIISGPGGMPSGSEQRVFCEINSKRDLVACWLMIKRGCKVMILPKISIKPLKKWLYSDYKIIKKIDDSCLKLPKISGDSLKNVKSDNLTFYPICCLNQKEIDKLFKKINK
ncbi:MAG: THUMP domain-containing protein [Candidatus Aenigmatarchaeota archaeon]